MRIRTYREEDLDALARMHAQSGFAYDFPELRDWHFNPKLVVESQGQVVMAAALRLTSEAYLWLDKEAGTPAERWQQLLALHEAVRREAERLGYADVHAFLPPEVARGFQRRLSRLGWIPEKFQCYWRRTERAN